MATLTGRAPKDTYGDLIQVSNSNSGVDGTLRFVSDGKGGNSTLKLSSSTAQFTTTLLTTGLLTTTAGITSGSNILSDTDSTDSLGSTSVRWLKGWFDTLTAGTLTIGSGSVTDSSGAISFGNENLTTTGIVTAAGTSVFTNLDISGNIDVDGTSNLDIVDIDGAVDMATTLQVDGVATFTGRDVHSGGITIANAGQIGSVGDTDAIAIASDGVVTLTQKLIGTELDISGDIDVDGTTNLDIVDIDGAVNMATTALVTGVLTTTATQVATGGITSGSDIISDTDSTDSLGSSSVRWLKLWVDTLTAGTLTIGSGSITDSSGAISFGNENLTTTGTLASGAATITGDITFSGANPQLIGGDADGTFIMSNASAGTGSSLVLYGVTHATRARDFALRYDSTDVIDYDYSAAEVTVTAKLKTTAGVSGGTAYAGADDFVVDGSGSEVGITILGNTWNYLMFGDSASGLQGQISYNHSTNKMTLVTAGSEALGIDSSQNATFAGNITQSSGANRSFYMGGTGSNHSQRIQMLNSTNRNWQIASGWATANDLDFTPSTSGGGTTFSNYVLRLEGDTGNAIFSGALSKGSGSFRIAHPLPELNETHNLVHSFIEGPQADLIYRGKVKLVKGKAEINIDESSDMTEGTFEVLCGDVQCFTTNETDWCPIKGSVEGNILKIVAKDKDCKDTISWMVIGERKDQHILETDWTDDEGHVIVEPLKPVEAEDE